MNTVQERNKSLARRWFHEVWNERRFDPVDEIADPGATGHLEGIGTSDMDQFKKLHAAMVGSFSDLHVEVDQVLAEGDQVVVRWRLRGTHDGDKLGFPASGQAIDVPGMTWLRFQDGKLVEGQDAWNQGELMQRLRDSPS